MSTVPEPLAPTPGDLRLLVQREQARLRQARSRARRAQERVAAASKPNATGYVIPRCPLGLRNIRRWVIDRHRDRATIDKATGMRRISTPELAECRTTARTLMDSYRASADVRRAKAMLKAAEAAHPAGNGITAVTISFDPARPRPADLPPVDGAMVEGGMSITMPVARKALPGANVDDWIKKRTGSNPMPTRSGASAWSPSRRHQPHPATKETTNDD